MSGASPAIDRVEQYEQSHRHPANRLCHFVGIPLIVVSLVMALVALVVDGMWSWAISFFVAGWILQFVGHVFERKPPEFFKDWRFLFVGLRWWSRKVMGRGH